ncbi:hypothetical protein ACEV85_09725 [Vibrio parahaemolyticus]|uniref:hypothetical protein n=1 Tax=Vibrio TaxID=662 RepID=UPI0020A5005C|nr:MULTISPECIES: hypothetical protein [unclassified Vibrio]MDW1754579.1 hypothetical protein [Vibrio sp. Vb2535]MDW2186914.1 hypothetical protein [Vibrio sp. 1733]MDW2236737.1 hypothetical protein [Vibrio sp. 1565-1]
MNNERIKVISWVELTQGNWDKHLDKITLAHTEHLSDEFWAKTTANRVENHFYLIEGAFLNFIKPECINEVLCLKFERKRKLGFFERLFSSRFGDGLYVYEKSMFRSLRSTEDELETRIKMIGDLEEVQNWKFNVLKYWKSIKHA